VVGIVFSTQMGKLLPKEAANISNNPANWLACGLLLAGAFYLSQSLQKKKPLHGITGMGIAFSLLAVVSLQAIVPQINQATQGTLMAYIGKVGKNPLATYEITKPSLTFYAQRRILAIKHKSNNDQIERDTLKAFLASGCTLNHQDLPVQQESGQPSGSKNSVIPCKPVYLITKNRFVEPLMNNVPPNAHVRFVDKSPVYSLIELKQK
jgi:hypothetical protein